MTDGLDEWGSRSVLVDQAVLKKQVLMSKVVMKKKEELSLGTDETPRG